MDSDEQLHDFFVTSLFECSGKWPPIGAHATGNPSDQAPGKKPSFACNPSVSYFIDSDLFGYYFV